jgi:hypothetical protein
MNAAPYVRSAPCVSLKRADDDLGEIASRHFVPEQILHLTQQVVPGLVQRELDAIALQGQRRDAGVFGGTRRRFDVARSDGFANLPRGRFAVCIRNGLHLHWALFWRRELSGRLPDREHLRRHFSDQLDLARGVRTIMRNTLPELADQGIVGKTRHRDAPHERTPRRGRVVEG